MKWAHSTVAVHARSVYERRAAAMVAIDHELDAARDGKTGAAHGHGGNVTAVLQRHRPRQGPVVSLLGASVLLATEDSDDENHEAARTLMRGPEPLTTLDLAHYETSNVAIRAWRDTAAADRLRRRIQEIEAEGGIVAATSALVSAASSLADKHGITMYAADYVAAAQARSAELVSCDDRALVSRSLEILPSAAINRV